MNTQVSTTQPTAVPGVLYIVATPIGNREDFSVRAIQTLRKVALIAAEDTRHSKKLLQHWKIETPVVSLHQYNEQEKSMQLLKKLQDGQQIALICDAGTPTISDPGYCLIQQIHTQCPSITIRPIPGCCALITALSCCGFSTQKFIFEGFLPSKATQRQKHLQQLATETRTLVFYEAPHRIMACLHDMMGHFGPLRPIVLARELTKRFETIYANQLQNIIQQLSTTPHEQKGEFVIAVQGAPIAAANTSLSTESARILETLAEELSPAQAIKLTAKITGERKNTVYQRWLRKTAGSA